MRRSPYKRGCPVTFSISHIPTRIRTDSPHQLFSKVNLKSFTKRNLVNTVKLSIVFFKTTALLRYLALRLISSLKTCNNVNTFSFLKIKDKNSKDSAHFLFLIIVRHPKVVTLVYSPKLTKSLTYS